LHIEWAHRAAYRTHGKKKAPSESITWGCMLAERASTSAISKDV
jgi:hypothetical protein